VFHVSIWGFGALFGGAKSTEAPPWRRDCATPLYTTKHRKKSG